MSKVYRAEAPGRPWDLLFEVGSCVLKPHFYRTLQLNLVLDHWFSHTDLLFLGSALLPGKCKPFLLRLWGNRLFLDCQTQSFLPLNIPLSGLCWHSPCNMRFTFTLWTNHGWFQRKITIFWTPNSWINKPTHGQIREGDGTPLQFSCLDNPMDGGAWWAALYGVTQSQTRLKWLSI